DARVGLERERARRERQQFDVLAVDAFSGDAIPVHLLTRECFEVYRYHLKPDGILALHISSRYFDLRSVVRAAVAEHSDPRVNLIWVEDSGRDSQGTDSTDWLLVTSNAEFLESQEVQHAGQVLDLASSDKILWTDDYSNLLRVLSRK